METLILAGLLAALLISVIGGLLRRRPAAPQIIYVYTPDAPTGGAGCLPLIVLVVVVLLIIMAV